MEFKITDKLAGLSLPHIIRQYARLPLWRGLFNDDPPHVIAIFDPNGLHWAIKAGKQPPSKMGLLGLTDEDGINIYTPSLDISKNYAKNVRLLLLHELTHSAMLRMGLTGKHNIAFAQLYSAVIKDALGLYVKLVPNVYHIHNVEVKLLALM